jgi:ribosomal-protein-alanine N-acetyltransferase
MIQPVSHGDLPRVLALEAQCHPQPWNRAAFVDELANQGRRSLFLKSGDPLAAYIVAWRIAGELQIQNVTTAPEERKKGHARRLLEAVLAEPHSEATLEVREGNLAAIALYSALGFVRVGLRPGYYTSGDAAVLMRR